MGERQVTHLARLVDDLLDVSRITRGRIELKRERVEVGAIVARALELSSTLLEQRRQHFTLRVPTEGLALYGDATRLSQVVSNLVTNAAKYTEPGGHILVRAEREGENVVLSVRDDGIGIAPAMLDRVFDLFVQAEGACARAPGGLGIGLTLVKSLVELHGGHVEARSEGLGHGTEVRVSLPACAAAR